MKVILFILLVLTPQLYSASELTAKSYQKVKIGMTGKEAKAIMKAYESSEGHHYEDDSCYYLTPKEDQPGANIMVLDGLVARFDVYEKEQDVKTTKGIGIGSTKKDVLIAYPDLVASEHEYLGSSGEYLTIKQGEDHAIIFETYKDVVTSFRLGKFPAVGYIEGCS